MLTLEAMKGNATGKGPTGEGGDREGGPVKMMMRELSSTDLVWKSTVR